MRKIILYFTILASVFAFCACGKPDSNIDGAGSGENITAGEDGNIAPKTAVPAAFGSIISLYQKAGTEKWAAEKLIENGLNYLYANLYEGDPLENLGYYINDINGDGVSELLIVPVNNSAEGYDVILDLYTISGGKANLVFQGAERNAYYLTKDGNISNVGSSSAFETAYYLYSLKNGALELKEGVLLNGMYDQNNPWFLTTDEDFDPSNDTPVSEDEALAKIQSYEDNYAEIPWTFIKNYK